MKALLLTIDAWRASQASFVPGTEHECTPELERFAEDATVFTQALCHGPATPYAFPSLFTSTYPLDHGGYEHLSAERTPVAEPLSTAGWHCVGVHSNPWLGEKYGFDRGFDEYRDVGEFGLPFMERGREFLVDRFGLDHPVYGLAQRLYRRLQGPLRAVSGEGTDEVSVAREALVDADDGTFVWTHLLDPHAPYAPPERHRRAHGVADVDGVELTTRAQQDPASLSDDDRADVEALYAASVRHADERAGRILEAVDNDTLVVVTADHGEALFEHGRLGHGPDLYEELVHVPLFVRPPGGAATDVVDDLVRHVDVAPTLLDYADVTAPPSYRGQSLRPLVEGEDRRPVRALLEVASTEARPGEVDPATLTMAVREPTRKLVYEDGSHRGYDLAEDPRELDPDPAADGDDWATMRRVVRDRRDALDLEGTDAEFDAATEQRLRDLGYLE
jgi:arylsulfatase A-like enzyme